MDKDDKEKSLKKEFGRLIRGLRLEQGMSIEEFEHVLGVDKATVDRMENGGNPPSFSTFSRLHKKGKIDINVLIKSAIGNSNYFEESTEEDSDDR
ncbi:helix-turn-helix domain-containing protein [Bacillus sp. FJAT-45066]|uniref:helix-turn-helix domain-containing protein n=1 Tax=Bacillus sp. FJAT-45066 TaxID=2011010 RepID=UPI000BB99162|nr:helix-turn-helix transcriptional regulator [Bacillus sp. FJAT-45066]